MMQSMGKPCARSLPTLPGGEAAYVVAEPRPAGRKRPEPFATTRFRLVPEPAAAEGAGNYARP